MMKTTMRRVAASGIGAAVLMFAAAGTAGAHVTVSPGEAPAGTYAVLTVSVPHGCDGSATTEVAIQIPEQTPTVTPSVNPNWDVKKVMVELDEPMVDSHGNELTERVGQVVYTAKTPLPDDLRDAFELSVRMPDTPGDTLAFPTVQTCEEGEHAWVQLAAEGEDPGDLDEPAPLVTVTEPSAENNPSSQDDSAAEETVEAASQGDDESNNALAIGALAAGVLGIGVGGAALARTRRRA